MGKMASPNLFYAMHAINPYRHLMDHLRMLPGGGDMGGVVRHVFAWTEAAESLRVAENVLAVVGSDYRREMLSHRKTLAKLPPDAPERREYINALGRLERGGYEELTWRLNMAARAVMKCQARLDEIDTILRQVTAEQSSEEWDAEVSLY